MRTDSLPRDRHLFAPGPKRILGLDGGGVRGIVSIAFLERIAAVLEKRAGHSVRLCDYFDLIGGTSTGAIIATALALGYSPADIKQFYFEMTARIFRRSPWRFAPFQSKFDAKGLRAELHAILGERTIGSEDLQTGLAIVMKRADTGSPWTVSNNPKAKYWETPADRGFIGNRHFLLKNLVRASAAAPHFFAPELLDIIEGDAPGLFLDGAVSPHNNPALQLLLMATLQGYRLEWPSGADQLLLVSVGTGSYRAQISAQKAGRMPSLVLAGLALSGLIGDGQSLVLLLLCWLSGQAPPWPLNSEIGSLEGTPPPGGQPTLSFRRYDIHLDARWLGEHCGVAPHLKELQRLRMIDDPGVQQSLYDMASAAAKHFVREEDFPATFDLRPQGG